MSNGEVFKEIEKHVKSMDSQIELFCCDYDKYGLKRIVIRIPIEENKRLKEKLVQQGWEPGREEYINTEGERNTVKQIKGWLPSYHGIKYLRLSLNI